MGRLVVLSENVLNTRIFPSHVLTANEEAAGREVSRVSSGRRQRALNHWTPSTTNAAAYVQAAFNRVRLVDCVFLDRGHNLGGKTVRIRASSDGFGTYTEQSATVPSQVQPFSRLSDVNGVRTEEGAWGWRFNSLSGLAVRFYVDAMGSGLRPEIVGLYIGQCFRPTNPLVKPFSHGKRELDYEIIRAPSMWAGAGEVSQRKRTTLRIRLTSGEYPAGRYHMEELFLRARPSWIVPDDDETEKAYLSRAEPQTAGFEIAQGRSEWEGEFDAPEHEPRIAA